MFRTLLTWQQDRAILDSSAELFLRVAAMADVMARSNFIRNFCKAYKIPEDTGGGSVSRPT